MIYKSIYILNSIILMMYLMMLMYMMIGPPSNPIG